MTAPDRQRGLAVVDPATLSGGPYPYVFVEEDCSVRELHPAERAYLETRFEFGDGARPVTKWRYGSRALFVRSRSGYLKRSRLPRRIVVGPAPAEDPFPPMSAAEVRADFERDGWTTVDNPDGTYTAYPHKQRSLPLSAS